MLTHVARLAALAALLLSWSLPALSQSTQAPLPEWITALRGGGHVIVLRHGATNPDQADIDPLNIKDISKQRHLSDQGRLMAKAIGDSMHKLKIPVGQVQTSMFYRAIETGTLLGFGDVSSSLDFTEGGLVVTPKENERRALALRRFAATSSTPDANVIVVTPHKPNIMDAFGKDWFDVREGEASIFKPDGGGGYRLVARVQAGDWGKLAQMAN